MDDPKVAELLGTRDDAIDGAAALLRFRKRARGIAPYGAGRAGARRLAAIAAAVAVLLVALGATGIADSIFKIFETKQVTTITVGSGDLAGLPDLSRYGTLVITQQPALTRVPDLSAAASLAGFRALTPTALPAGVPSTVEITVVSPTVGTFTFDASKAAGTAAAQGTTLPPMPAAIDGTTLTATQGTAIVQAYGARFDPKTVGPHSVPPLIVGRAKPLVVTSNGASLDDLRAYLLAQPGISPALAAQIRAIGDPAGTLPLLVPLDLAVSKKVTVGGAPGVFVGDSTGLGSGVLWISDGLVNFVGGTLSESQLLEVANSLR